MKKILVMALCVTAVISMTACGQTKSQETNSAKQAVSSTAVKADSGKTESSKADVSESVSSVTEAEYDPAKDLALLGGWAAPDSPAVTDEIRSKLEKALKGLTGAEYEPVAYLGSQVVAGMNYRLLCLVKPVTPDAKQYYAVVTLYESLDGEVSVSEVQKCDKEIVINGLAGGWFRTETPEVTKEAEAVLEKALEGLAGADYNPTALLATQVVAGTNYCYLCEVTPVVPNAESHYALVYVYEDLEGNAEITEVVDFENEEKTEEDESQMMQIANPFVDYETLEEAAAAAKLEMSAPEKLKFSGNWERSYQAVSGDFAQVIYKDGDNKIFVRKGHGEEDISGDYNLYSVEELVKVGDYEVLLKGTGVIYNTAVWTHDGYTYAIMSELPLEKDAMISIIEEVK